MSTRTAAPSLPDEVRRALWDRLWREVLLRPRDGSTGRVTGE
jgi:hypothetical protein